jgi:hypothetical protein
MASIFRCTSGVAIFLVLITVTLLTVPIVWPQQRTRRPNSSRAKSVTSKVKGAEWHSFRGPDNDFTLEFPSEPKRVEDVQGGVTVLRRYALTTQSAYFEISIQDTGGVPNSSYANEFSPNFEQTTSQMMGEDGIKIVQLRRTTKGSYEMEVLSPTLDRKDYLHGLRRGLIRNGRIYSMACDSLFVGREADRNICRRFFNSFRIVGLPQ